MDEALRFLKEVDDSVLRLFEQHAALGAAILALLVFSQTGTIIGPVFPGNVILFTGGIATHPSLGLASAPTLAILLVFAAFLGNLSHYALGRWAGNRPWVHRVLTPTRRERTLAFFDRHGRSATAIAFFLPFIRTFAPLIAGSVRMSFSVFLVGSLIGAFAWVIVLMALGYLFGQVPLVRENLGLLAILAGVLFGLKAAVDLLRRRRATAAA